MHSLRLTSTLPFLPSSFHSRTARSSSSSSVSTIVCFDRPTDRPAVYGKHNERARRTGKTAEETKNHGWFRGAKTKHTHTQTYASRRSSLARRQGFKEIAGMFIYHTSTKKSRSVGRVHSRRLGGPASWNYHFSRVQVFGSFALKDVQKRKKKFLDARKEIAIVRDPSLRSGWRCGARQGPPSIRNEL